MDCAALQFRIACPVLNYSISIYKLPYFHIIGHYTPQCLYLSFQKIMVLDLSYFISINVEVC